MLASAAVVLASAALAASAAVPAYPDAPYSVSQATVRKAITCPFRSLDSQTPRAGGTVLLVHGTGSTGRESWGNGPYSQFLPTAGKGYDICWIDLPGRSEVDAQISAVYVAQAVRILAPGSKTKKVSIIGHSQGAGINPQWALTFFPSIQPLVQNYIALAPDFNGSIEGNANCNAITKSCTPATWQQTMGSHYLAAQNHLGNGGGGRALVPTTSIYTQTDDIIQPETPPLGPTSYLPGAFVHAIQDLDFCGPAHVADHFTLVTDSGAYGLAFATLEAGHPVDMSMFDKSYCYLKGNTMVNPANTVPTLQGLTNDINNGQPSVSAEPALQPYVCARGFAKNCAAKGFAMS